MRRSSAAVLSSSGAVAAQSRYQASFSAASSAGKYTAPANTSAIGWRRNSSAVTTPKLPPPPRSAQKRSGLRSALAVTVRPSAVTTSARTTLSAAKP
jgi:hypothetical protein